MAPPLTYFTCYALFLQRGRHYCKVKTSMIFCKLTNIIVAHDKHEINNINYTCSRLWTTADSSDQVYCIGVLYSLCIHYWTTSLNYNVDPVNLSSMPKVTLCISLHTVHLKGLTNLVSCPWFAKLKPSKLVFTFIINNLIASRSIHLPSFLHQCTSILKSNYKMPHCKAMLL